MALVEGLKYGLSSQYQNSQPNANKLPSNKSVLFVKLTDSALKAIEEYLKSQQKTGQHATLQFRGNEGHIVIPSSQSSQGQTFDFSLQSNADIEGPQGSFECIQQCGSRSLESMGTLPYKMRIKANDDVYAETKQRFTALEEERKQECAKEIKPNGDLRGKVKKKFPDRLSPFGNQNPKGSPNSSCNSKFGSGLSQPSYGNGSNFKGSPGSLNGNNNNHVTNGKVPSSSNSNPGSLNIAKRPLKERLIHLLALKPFKKPELIARLSRDGIKDREKSLVMNILKQLSTFKDNEYILMRGIWNDVQEDWPYYTEQEKQIMKRRKPQNLTPPGSDSSVSSGISGCGSSPRSTISNGSSHSPPSSHQSSHYSSSQLLGSKSMSSHKGSLSNGTSTSSGNQGVKRPAPIDPQIGPDGLLTENASGYGDHPNNKKPRVSHFKRPNRSSNSNGGGGSGGGSSSSSSSYGANGGVGNGANNTSRSSDRDGLSPHFHSNRTSDRLSPINGNGSGGSIGGLSQLMVNDHRSPRNISPRGGNSSNILPGGDAAGSPSYYTGSNIASQALSPSQDDPMLGGNCSPYMWNSKNFPGGVVPSHHDSQSYLDSNKSRGMDSDETDSIDSGNGSSGSSSGSRRHHFDEQVNGFGGTREIGVNNEYHSSRDKSQSKSKNGSYSSNAGSAEPISNGSLHSANSGNSSGSSNFNGPTSSSSSSTSAGCNRVSSTTHNNVTGGTNGYNHSTPQSSPDSQVDNLQLIHQTQRTKEASSTAGCESKSVTMKDTSANGRTNNSGGNSSGGGASSNGASSGRNNGYGSHGGGGGLGSYVMKEEDRLRNSNSSVREQRSSSKSDRDKERTRGDRREYRDHRSESRRNNDRESRWDRSSGLHVVNGGGSGESEELHQEDFSSAEGATHYPPYLTQYARIETEEQRNRYKDDFNAEYQIYRDLHAVIERVSRKFAQLELRLREEERGTTEYQAVRDEIVTEYHTCKRDKRYQEAKEKFNYLHKKLSHIKSLVAEFDRNESEEQGSPVR